MKGERKKPKKSQKTPLSKKQGKKENETSSERKKTGECLYVEIKKDGLFKAKEWIGKKRKTRMCPYIATL